MNALNESPFREAVTCPVRLRISLVTLGVGVLAALGLWGLFSTFIGMRTVSLATEGLEEAGLSAEVERLRGINRALRAELALAEGDGPYLVLDPSEGNLTLKSHGVALREFPAVKAVFRMRRAPRFWGWLPSALDTTWGEGVLLPHRHKNRVVIVSDSVAEPDLSGSVSFIPPTPEEEFPTPSTFRVRFSGGLSLVVVALQEEAAPGDNGRSGIGGLPFLGRVAQWVRLEPWDPGLAQLEISMDQDNAGSLYRSFGDGTPLLVSGNRGG